MPQLPCPPSPQSPPPLAHSSSGQSFHPGRGPEGLTSCPLRPPGRPVTPMAAPEAHTTSTEHPGGHREPEEELQREHPALLPPPPQPHSNRDLNVFPELGASQSNPPPFGPFALTEIPTEKEQLFLGSQTPGLASVCPQGWKELGRGEPWGAAPPPQPQAAPGPGRKPRGRKGPRARRRRHMWGRRWRKPLPHRQNLGVGGQRKRQAPCWPPRGFLGTPSRLPDGGIWGLEPQWSQPG